MDSDDKLSAVSDLVLDLRAALTRIRDRAGSQKNHDLTREEGRQELAYIYMDANSALHQHKKKTQ